MRLRDLMDKLEEVRTPFLEEIVITENGSTGQLLREGKYVPGRFERNIRIDQPTHGVGQQHAHVSGRNGKEYVVVNFDGSASHKMKGRLHQQDADALRDRGFNIPPNNIVECARMHSRPRLLLE